jgi:hypothetical protein
LSEVPEDNDRPNQGDEEEIPRQGLLAAMPKRTFYRVALLLAALAGIIYLRQRTASIASCMSNAFRLPPPMEQRSPSSAIRARVMLPADPSKTP